MGTGSFPGVKNGRGWTLTPHPLLVPWSWKSRATPLLPLWAVRPVQSLSACKRVHFTFFNMVRGSNPGGGAIFRMCPDRPRGPPSLLYNRYRVFPGVKSGQRVTLTPHLLLEQWSWKSRAIPVLPLWVVRPVQSLSACTRIHFTFF